MKARNFFILLLVSALFVTGSKTEVHGESNQTVSSSGLAKATFAGGCFWCMEHPFDELDGVLSTTVGYTGGHKKDPTYEEVSAGNTGHTEAVRVIYNPKNISYARLLDVFWRNVDPLTPNRQFCDVGSQYRAGIFYHAEEQKRLAEQSKKELKNSKRFQQPIVTEITRVSEFHFAEDYHQDFY